MLTSEEIESLARVCRRIGNEVADADGFVPIRNLLGRFQADIHIRPLLVEGMLASIEDQQSSNKNRWAVLIDSETYPVTQDDIKEERPTNALPSRLRNTIAHELVHSLGFRPSEFGVTLKAKTDDEASREKIVRAIEAHTERLSPLLLWSERALENLIDGKKTSVTLADFLHVVEAMGVSRYVLVNRLTLLRPTTDSRFLSSPGLRNTALCLGEWGPHGAALKGWPLFWNFIDGAVPSFLWQIPGQERVPADSVFSDPSFALRGGPNSVVQFMSDAGTRAVQNATKMVVEVSVEDGLRSRGEQFLVLVRRVDG